MSMCRNLCFCKKPRSSRCSTSRLLDRLELPLEAVEALDAADTPDTELAKEPWDFTVERCGGLASTVTGTSPRWRNLLPCGKKEKKRSFTFSVVFGKPLSWQKVVKVLTSLGKVHQSHRPPRDPREPELEGEGNREDLCLPWLPSGSESFGLMLKHAQHAAQPHSNIHWGPSCDPSNQETRQCQENKLTSREFSGIQYIYIYIYVYVHITIRAIAALQFHIRTCCNTSNTHP